MCPTASLSAAPPGRSEAPATFSAMVSRLRGKRWLRWAGLVVALLVVAAVVVVVLATRRQGDVSNPAVEFRQAQTQAPAPVRQGHPANPFDDGFEWPVFGYTKNRTHVLELANPLRPPFKRAWAVHGSTLIEFSPVLCKRSVYLLKNNGALYKISRLTGQVKWKLKLGDLAAASPACSHGAVYAVLLNGKNTNRGRAVAVAQRNGAVIWSRPLPSRSESSPLLDHGRLYFGSQNGTVYALRAADGAVRWTFHAAGAVKGALALDGGRLYFGDYSGNVYSLRRSNGSVVWRTNAAGGGPLGGGGNFYSSAAVEYGRVYIGNTNGAVYSFAEDSGKLAWRKQTGNYVYSSPAVGQVGGGPPTVWIGSYNGTFYALNARDGSVRWSRDLGGKLSGSPVVIGDLVFVSAVNLRQSWALGANTGQTLWLTHRGAFNPAISDGKRIYFNGYSTLFGLDPRGANYGTTTRTARPKPARPAPRPRPKPKAKPRPKPKPHGTSTSRRLEQLGHKHLRYLRRVCHEILQNPHRRHRRLRAHHCYWYFSHRGGRR